jgi:hypothetical protein
MDHAHKSNPYDPNSCHRHKSFALSCLCLASVFMACLFFTSFTEFLAHFLALWRLSYPARRTPDRIPGQWEIA